MVDIVRNLRNDFVLTLISSKSDRVWVTGLSLIYMECPYWDAGLPRKQFGISVTGPNIFDDSYTNPNRHTHTYTIS